MKSALLCLLFVIGCAHVDTRRTVLSLHGLDCGECASEFMPQIEKQPGVVRAEFDKSKVEVTLETDPTFDVARAIAAIEKAGFRAVIGAGSGRYVAGAAYPEGADAKVVVDDGSDVPDLARLAVAGKVTVVDFYADWCGPCKEVDKHLAALIATRADLAVRKLNVVSWESALAKHYLAEAPSMPYQVVLARDGRRVAAIAGLDLAALDRAIADGAR
jgi:thiol-disulfide isomerase/thioredoxin